MSKHAWIGIITILETGAAYGGWLIGITGGSTTMSVEPPQSSLRDILDKKKELIRQFQNGTIIPEDTYKAYLSELSIYSLYDDEADRVAQLSKNGEDAGFGTETPRDYTTINAVVNEGLKTKITEPLRSWLTDTSFYIYQEPSFEAVTAKTAWINPMIIKSTIYPQATIYLLRGNTERPMSFTVAAFYDSETLIKEIRSKYDTLENTVIHDWDTATNPRTQTRSGLTIGVSIAYSHTFFYDEKIKYGIYTGVEAFGEITPKAMKSHGFKVKEKEVGLRPFLGVECRDSWRIFILGGLKLRQLDTKYFALHQRKTKPAFEIGIGSEYLLSEKYSIGLKLIKTMKQRHKMKYNTKFTTTSLKILFSFGMRF